MTATILAHEQGPKIRIGKYKKRTGYKRHNGFRAATSRVQITLGAKKATAAPPAAAKKRSRGCTERGRSPKAAHPPKGYEGS